MLNSQVLSGKIESGRNSVSALPDPNQINLYRRSSMATQELNINRSPKQPRPTKHCRRPARGDASERVYNIWRKMLNRCYVPNADGYQYYGGKGITVCKRWRESCIHFYADMGEPPTVKHSLDRKDGNGNYEPGNCKWSTRREQVENRSCTIWVVVDGTRRTLKEACEVLGVSYMRTHQRMKRFGWSAEEALAIRENMSSRRQSLE